MKRKKFKPIKFGTKPFGIKLHVLDKCGDQIPLSELSNEHEFLMNEAMTDSRRLGHQPSVRWEERFGMRGYIGYCQSCGRSMEVYPFSLHQDNGRAGIHGHAATHHCDKAPKSYKGRV